MLNAFIPFFFQYFLVIFIPLLLLNFIVLPCLLLFLIWKKLSNKKVFWSLFAIMILLRFFLLIPTYPTLPFYYKKYRGWNPLPVVQTSIFLFHLFVYASPLIVYHMKKKKIEKQTITILQSLFTILILFDIAVLFAQLVHSGL